eukprot:GHVP01007471.1.p1 GENE.GHVP01007471.1~~GHVP01007471.1.p1  ORF type:complete len:152 (+),score=27.10 GHVP01007471.1:475-930(+)
MNEGKMILIGTLGNNGSWKQYKRLFIEGEANIVSFVKKNYISKLLGFCHPVAKYGKAINKNLDFAGPLSVRSSEYSLFSADSTTMYTKPLESAEQKDKGGLFIGTIKDVGKKNEVRKVDGVLYKKNGKIKKFEKGEIKKKSLRKKLKGIFD